MKIIVANWKMNGTIDYINDYFKFFLPMTKNRNSKIIFATPYVFLDYIRKIVSNFNIEIFAQNCHNKENGAFTGEISVEMLSSMDINGSIIGHYERKQYGETDKEVNEKLKLLLKHNMKPIICVGETQKNEKKNEINNQIEKYLDGIENAKNLFFAYEPVWAIGSGVQLDINEINSSICAIKKVLQNKNFEDFKILYGGSVNKNNANKILKSQNIDGVLVGKESLDPAKFSDICNLKV